MELNEEFQFEVPILFEDFEVVELDSQSVEYCEVILDA